MELNLPIFDQLSQCQNLLIAGMGGGFVPKRPPERIPLS